MSSPIPIPSGRGHNVPSEIPSSGSEEPAEGSATEDEDEQQPKAEAEVPLLISPPTSQTVALPVTLDVISPQSLA